MRDQDCIALLQWCLPQLGLRWPGYRKVRRTVCKRVDRRIRELGLSGPDAYRDYLVANAGEWQELETFCRIPISRFYRDREVFKAIETVVLPDLATRAAAIRCWSAGCASGEEPYTLAIIWQCGLRQSYPEVRLDVLATDADPTVLQRAAEGCYAEGSLRELPNAYRECAFVRRGPLFCVRPDIKGLARFERQDISKGLPQGKFDLILCRNLVLTYFQPDRQREILRRLGSLLSEGSYLTVGSHERLPADVPGFLPLSEKLPIYRRLGSEGRRSNVR